MTQLVGILNLTPDSFSDGGAYITPAAALAQASTLLREGAAVLDVGAESTRPGATPISWEEEWKRLSAALPRLVELATRAGAALSVDTRHARTALMALQAGADWINDVSGAASRPLLEAVAQSRARYVLMHALSVPADPSLVVADEDVVKAVLHFAQDKLVMLEKMGISRARIIFDPGIGFGKTAAQSRELIRRIAELKILGLPLLVGHSRKSFLGVEGSLEEKDRAGAALTAELARHGVDYVRVHVIGPHRQAALAAEAPHA